MEASARWVLSRSCEGKHCNSQPSLVVHVFPEVTSVGPQRKSVYSCWTVCWPSHILLLFSPIINIKACLKMLGLSHEKPPGSTRALHPQDWHRRVRTPYHFSISMSYGLGETEYAWETTVSLFKELIIWNVGWIIHHLGCFLLPKKHVNSRDKYMHKLFVKLTLSAKSRTVFVASMCLECIIMYH